MANSTTTPKVTKKRAPKPTSDKKRPNKSFILRMAEFRGHMTCNEKVQLEGLTVKNALQRINTKAMSETQFTAVQCEALKRVMKAFVKEINTIL